MIDKLEKIKKEVKDYDDFDICPAIEAINWLIERYEQEMSENKSLKHDADIMGIANIGLRTNLRMDEKKIKKLMAIKQAAEKTIQGFDRFKQVQQSYLHKDSYQDVQQEHFEAVTDSDFMEGTIDFEPLKQALEDYDKK
jgi:hypothetical protein